MLCSPFPPLLLPLFLLISCATGVPLAGRRGVQQEESSEYSVSPPLDQDWACGADEFSMLIAEATIDRDCPLQKNQFNQCCVAHDMCYEEQVRGQEWCDDVFCSCVQLAAAPNQQCEEEDAPAFCSLVREFGSEAYANAGSKNRSEYRI